MCCRSCEWFSVAEGLQMQEMRLEEQAIRNLNLDMKSMENNRRV